MLDARGLACPLPVVMVQREIKSQQPSSLEVLVDNRTAVENVSRFAASQGYQIEKEEQGEDFLLRLSK